MKIKIKMKVKTLNFEMPDRNFDNKNSSFDINQQDSHQTESSPIMLHKSGR